MPRRICVFIYLGRGSGLGRFTFEAMKSAMSLSELDPYLIISQNSAAIDGVHFFGDRIFFVPTFERFSSPSVLTGVCSAKRSIVQFIQERNAKQVITLMPHVWSPLMVKAIQRSGARYATIVHDEGAHPGDLTAVVNPWLLYDARQANKVVTLSQWVASRLVDRRHFEAEKIVSLFHPVMKLGAGIAERQFSADRPLKLLFFGRIMKYKGLPLCIDAVEILRREGVPVDLGVFGAGDISAEVNRLQRLGAEVVNRWLSDSEVSSIVARYDAMICSHIEASQSGVVATAFGALMPVVAFPVGGLQEQLIDGWSGVIANQVDAVSLAAAIRRLIREPDLYANISSSLRNTQSDWSMDKFVSEMMRRIGD